MFTIDLLKGSGVPIKNSPGTVALKALPFVLPLVVAVYLVGSFQFNRTVIAMEQSGVDKIQDKLAENAADIQQVRQWNSAAEQTQKNLAEVTRGLGRHVQWSQTLQTIVEQLPESVGLKEIKLSRSTTRKKVADSKDAKKQVNKIAIHRILTLQVYGAPSLETDEAIKQYLSRLGQAPAIRQRTKDIRIVSQQSDEMNGKPVTIHTIECEFKPQE
jgi:Tfp pilus assembly protein PilN